MILQFRSDVNCRSLSLICGCYTYFVVWLHHVLLAAAKQFVRFGPDEMRKTDYRIILRQISVLLLHGTVFAAGFSFKFYARNNNVLCRLCRCSHVCLSAYLFFFFWVWHLAQINRLVQEILVATFYESLEINRILTKLVSI